MHFQNEMTNKTIVSQTYTHARTMEKFFSFENMSFIEILAVARESERQNLKVIVEYTRTMK